MAEFDLKIIPSDAPVSELVSLKAAPRAKQKEVVVESVELSKGIQAFDKKVANKSKVYTTNPYSYNSVSLKNKTLPSNNPEVVVTKPIYNLVGKFLGVDTAKDWSTHYQKIYTIVEWAMKKSGFNTPEKVMSWIAQKSRSVPSMGQGRRIDELHLFAKMYFTK